MQTLKTLIADPDMDFREQLKRRINSERDIEVVGTTENAWELLRMVQNENPDVLVVDLTIENGMQMLPYTQMRAKPPEILATSNTGNELMTPLSSALGIRFFRKTDRQIGDLIACMRQIIRKLAQTSGQQNVEMRISEFLRQLGIPAHMKGYKYLRRAIKMIMEDPEMMRAVTKTIYPDVAKYFGTSASCVERAIRSAIETAWVRGNMEYLQKSFGNTIKPDTGRPTNSEFIATVADTLLLQHNSMQC